MQMETLDAQFVRGGMRSFSEEHAYVLGDLLEGRYALRLVVGNVDNMPAHGDKSVRPSGILDSHDLPFMRFVALVFNVDFLIGPAKVAPEV